MYSTATGNTGQPYKAPLVPPPGMEKYMNKTKDPFDCGDPLGSVLDKVPFFANQRVDSLGKTVVRVEILVIPLLLSSLFLFPGWVTGTAAAVNGVVLALVGGIGLYMRVPLAGAISCLLIVLQIGLLVVGVGLAILLIIFVCPLGTSNQFQETTSSSDHKSSSDSSDSGIVPAGPFGPVPVFNFNDLGDFNIFCYACNIAFLLGVPVVAFFAIFLAFYICQAWQEMDFSTSLDRCVAFNADLLSSSSTVTSSMLGSSMDQSNAQLGTYASSNPWDTSGTGNYVSPNYVSPHPPPGPSRGAGATTGSYYGAPPIAGSMTSSSRVLSDRVVSKEFKRNQDKQQLAHRPQSQPRINTDSSAYTTLADV